jgi:signal transduction histidine kinase
MHSAQLRLSSFSHLSQRFAKLTSWHGRLRLTRRSAVGLSLALTVLAALGDLITGVEVPFTLLYLAPIGIATWFVSYEFALMISVLCTLAGASTQIVLLQRAQLPLNPAPIAWTYAATLVLFCLFAYVLTWLRTYVEREERDRRLAIDQLRHAERLNVVGKLAAGVAHELGTPLNVILASVEMIGENQTDTAFAHKQLGVIAAQTQRMTDIIRQLLDFSRKGGAGRRDIDLREVVTDVVQLLQPSARKAEVELVTELESRPVTVSANRVELGQVVSNLVLNALQATPKGGSVRVTCCEEPAAGRESFDAATACIAVEDSGTGISPEHIPLIFDPFFTTKAIGLGTGLGLSVSYGIVQDHGGSIHVQSRLDEGTCFVVRLPLTRADRALGLT